MPIAEKKQAHNAKSVPLGILNKGPEFFRQQALRNQRRHGKTAAEQLAESRSQFLKWDPATPQRQLNDNSNNHSRDSRLDSNRTDIKQTRERTVSPLVHEDKVIRQERNIEFEKRESRRGRDKNRDNRRSRKRTKERGNDVNGNSHKTIAFEKASLDSPEHDENLKDTVTPIKVSENGGETSGTTDEAEYVVQSRRSRSETRSKSSPRPSVKDIVSKIGSEKSNERTVDETPTRILDHSGRQRQKRTLKFVSSESSETSPVLPRRGDYFSRNTRPPAVRGRERLKPSPVLKPRSNVVNPKSPAGSHVQNVLNVLHQQASTSSSSHDETPKRNFRKSGARVRGRSCPPTSRSKPSLADLLAKDAEGGRPRSKDLNDLDNLPSPESDDSNIVKARIKSFQSPVSRAKQSLQTTLSKKLSNATSDELMPSIDGSSNHSLSKGKYPVEHQISATTSSNHFLVKSLVNSASPIKFEGKEPPKGKSEIHLNPSDLYSLPHKPTHRRHQSTSDVSHGSASSDKIEEPPVLHPKCISDGDITPIKKPLLKSKSVDVGLKSKGESWPSVKLPSSGKPALPKKPDLSIINKRTRVSYHLYEEVSDPNQEPAQETAVDPKDNVFENPVHFSDPDESFEIVLNVTDPTKFTLSCKPDTLSTKPDNVSIVVEHRDEEKEDPKQSSMFSSFSSHMKRLKGILLREKDPQISPREHEEQCDEQKLTEKATNSKLPDEQSSLFSKNGKKVNYQSPTQRKLAAQLGLECKEKLGEFNFDKHEEGTPLSYEGKIPKMSSGELGVKSGKGGDTESKNVKLMLPVHSKSFSWDDLNKKKRLKTSLSDNTALATSMNDDKATKGISDGLVTSSHGHFHMPHEKQKQDLSKKLELFLKQSKAYNSPGSSPTKGSCESGKLKKKVSFDATGIPEETGKTSEKQPLIRKVSITPLNQNYDEVEYNMDLKKDLVEETIIIDSSNSIRLATPRSKHPSTSSDTRVALKVMIPKIPKISEDSCRDLGDAAPQTGGKEVTGTEEVEMLVELYDDPITSHEKSFDKEPSTDDNKGGVVGRCQKTSKLVDFRKASVSTDLDTSPTHDYRGVPADGHSEVKHRSGTSSSGNARVKGEYDTSSRSDDCGLGATRGRVKHLKPYNARPFRNKNFSSDEDVIPEETTRKSFWQTKAQLDIPNNKLKTAQAVQQPLEGHESSADGDTSSQSSNMRRSKSEPSNATSAHELDRFFDKMGLDDSILEVAGKPHIYNEEEVFHEMHVWRTRGIRGSESDDSNTSYAMSETSNVSEEGVMNLRKFTKQLPDQSMSIVTKNARVIKWMCQCKKARNQSIS